jgi:2-oxopent-4-enoate hydratase
MENSQREATQGVRSGLRAAISSTVATAGEEPVEASLGDSAGQEPPSLEDLAAQLRDAERARRTIRPLSEQDPGLSVADSYRIQQLNVARRLRDGGLVIGQKIGLTSAAMQQQLGVDEPDYGVLFADMLVGDGRPIPVSGLIQPRAEAEVAFIMERELRGPGVTEADALEAVAGALPVIEVIDSRISAWKIGLVDTIADNASCARVVRGDVVTPIQDVDLRTIGMVLTVNGEVVSTAAGAAVLGNPIRGVVWLANKLAEFGTSLRPGDLVLAGALHASIPVAEGVSVRAEFASIGAITAEFTS